MVAVDQPAQFLLRSTSRALTGRWSQLLYGIACMSMIANLQYGWTLFVTPLDEQFHWGRPAIQVAFTLFVLAETWLVPVEGYLVDRFGARALIAVGAIVSEAQAELVQVVLDSDLGNSSQLGALLLKNGTITRDSTQVAASSFAAEIAALAAKKAQS